MHGRWLLCCAILVAILKGCCGLSLEADLITHLLNGYNREARPVEDASQAVQVSLDMALAQVIDVNDREQLITINVWLRHYWYDEHLKWNSSDYGNITSIRLTSTNIWLPDIVLYNNVFDEGFAQQPEVKAIVNSDGYVTYLYPFTFKASCLINVEFFPYDQQACPLKFSSWAYDGFSLNVTNRGPNGDLSNFIRNEEWSITELRAIRSEAYYSCCPEPYPDVTFYIIMKRESLYYLYYVVAPCIIILIISLLSFAMPPDSGEKLSLSTTMLLALVVFMQIVAENLPTTSRYIPFIGRYFGAIIAIVSLSSMLSIWILSFHFTNPNPKPPPTWLKRLLRMERRDEWAEWFFCGCCRAVQARSGFKIRRLSERSTSSDVNLKKQNRPKSNKVSPMPSQQNGNAFPHERQTKVPPLVTNSDAALLEKIDTIITEIRDTREEREEKEREEAIVNEWKEVAARLDRCLLGVFFVVSVLVNATMTYTNRVSSSQLPNP
ncbi:PREDICTED: neuronal acetylcholine receptor subunit alpha-10-like isoform X1 [Branchiostoma belcheri]|uniref:Neuronal acetylcholine receptor subunit alpha-10-like isoform X1 n=1 Tax=Branchiostoma belcheri TaxID=7741 RepID=A0A6P4YV54_BRABE|nr:PREDICTED: neuronal acetylcholine receptor subunit alpha-10-like isoform X1 [Branchiostoma belcheri]